METTLFCVFSHFLCDLFEELATLSLTLQKNDLILPQATTALLNVKCFHNRASDWFSMTELNFCTFRHTCPFCPIFHWTYNHPGSGGENNRGNGVPEEAHSFG